VLNCGNSREDFCCLFFWGVIGGNGHGDDQVLGLGKEEGEKTKWAQGKGIFDRAILFW